MVKLLGGKVGGFIRKRTKEKGGKKGREGAAEY